MRVTVTKAGKPAPETIEERLIGMNKPVRNRPRGKQARQSQSRPDGPVWLWGSHAVLAALANPARAHKRLVATENAARRLGLPDAEGLTIREIDRLLPPGAVHQGVALLTAPLEPLALDDLIAAAPARVCILDQVSDPHNLGAIFRSAAAFAFGGIILQTRHSPPVTGTLAKSAAGAVDLVSEVRVVNIARALTALDTAGYHTVGLAGDAELDIGAAVAGRPRVAIALGAEGAGLRPSVAGACHQIARIAMPGPVESLNVSNAAAIAFHETARGAISPQ
jgi:23S rRNA (guanosine2251-2'-O)-methyltransferase